MAVDSAGPCLSLDAALPAPHALTEEVTVEHAVAAAATPMREGGWVGWGGILERYPLRQGGGGPRAETRSEGLDGARPDCLVLGVAASAACGPCATLHAGSVWNGAVRLAQLVGDGGALQHRFARQVVCELGAGAGLPSLALLVEGECAGVVVSDYPDPEMLAALQANFERNCGGLVVGQRVPWRVVGHDWANDASIADLLAARVELDAERWAEPTAAGGIGAENPSSASREAVGSSAASQREAMPGFEAILLSEVLWEQGRHGPLVHSLARLLAKPHGEAWLAHSHHWSGHESADANFAALCEGVGFTFERHESLEADMATLFDPDEMQRVFVHRIAWSTPQQADVIDTSVT
mmetsp:Transcript_83394/g.232574  ORF Transcript_83394/g.232574 Transcript_83394/m.232574 type:complete len:353 (-) Transcript_83394:48-1106(-)